MNYVRPSLPVDFTDSWPSNIGNNINSHKPVAGSGMQLKRTPSGTIISALDNLDPTALNYTGPYSFSSSYQPNDVAFVDPNVIYYDQTGSAIPFAGSTGSATNAMSPGLFVCVNFVPAMGYDDNMLLTYVAPAYAASGQQITSTVADTFRHYDLNTYWPIYPVPTIPESYTTESSWTTIQNRIYWQPLCLSGAGSAGGGTFPVSVITEFPDYLYCHYVVNNIVNTASVLNVAKPYWLTQKYGILPYVTSSLNLPDGQHYYSTTGSWVNKRLDTVSGSGVTAIDIIWLPYVSGEILQASRPASGIGYIINDPLTSQNMAVIDLNQAGRKWMPQVGVACTTSFQIVDVSFPYIGSI